MCEEGLHDPFQNQVDCARFRAERDMLAQAMERVADDIEQTFLGFEGAEDAPAMRWAREFRAALGALHAPVRDATMSACDLTPDESREAAAWVREHGGLDEVRKLARYELREEVELAALGKLRCLAGVRQGESASVADMGESIERRLMPEGYEWPRYEDNEPVLTGNVLLDANGEAFRATSFLFTCDWWSVKGYQGTDFCTISKDTRRELSGMPYSRRVKRPAVLAADGEPLEVGQMVWDENGDEFRVLDLYGGPVDEDFPDHTVRCRRAGAEEYESTMCAPSQLTHQRPVLDADGVPIKKGDTVWCVATDDELTDMSIIWTNWSKMREKLTVKSFTTDVHGDKWADFEETFFCVKTRYLTHAKPEPPDSWERVEDDCSISERDYYAQLIGHDVGLKDDEEVHRAVSLDLVRRCKALAERGR